MSLIKEFYDKHNFPGPYSIDQLKNYIPINNRYINVIDQHLSHGQNILDVGCGTGLIVNLFALKLHSQFTGIDFSTAADYAKTFAKNNFITNAKFIKQDFFKHKFNQKYDVIISQSFITHVSDYEFAIKKMKSLLNPGGTIIISVYNNFGRILKNILPINYKNSRLKLDQKLNPCDVVFTHRQMLDLWKEYRLDSIMPSYNNQMVGFRNLFYYQNGGLTMYVFKDTTYDD